jgi:predicted RNA-binding Zn-ribbon protein involved in translation (DUF1610 family)
VAKIVLAQVWAKLPSDLKIPKYLNYKEYLVDTKLSARVMSSICTQVSGIVRAATEKQRRRLWVQENKNANISSVKFSQPKPQHIYPELSSKCCNIQPTLHKKAKFFGFLKLYSLGEEFGSFKLPIIKHPRRGNVPKAGVKLFPSTIQLVWDVATDPIKKGDKVIGADQGIETVLTLSDGQVTPESCRDKHTLSTILDKLARKRKGSDAFRKAVDHRKNFINWSIRQLNFKGVKEVRLEKIVNIRFGKSSSEKMSHWSNPEIRDSLKRRCEELEVPIIEQSCAYRSQRCSQCGSVRKANRKGKTYTCNACGYSADADFNASVNHSVDLPDASKFFGLKLNLGKGFYWKPTGFYTINGAELRVPLAARINRS